jgi:protein farnesyltransferase subunit beta
MPFRPLRRKKAVQFPKMATPDQRTRTPTSRITELDDNDLTTVPSGITQLTVDDDIPPVPALFANLPPIRDELVTESSEMQNETVQECLPFLSEPGGDLNLFGVSQLGRTKHIKYLNMMINGPLPAGFTAADASRPWMVYWALTGLYLLGEDVRQYRQR